LIIVDASAFNYKEQVNVIKPPKLVKGDEIRIVATSSFPDIRVLAQSINEITKLGFRISYGTTIKKLTQQGYSAGSPGERAKELNDAFADDNVKAIFSARGGHGAIQILPLLDYELIRNNPKIFMGYSDITSIHLAINKLSGVVTFHGPMPASDSDEFQGHNLTDMFDIFEGKINDFSGYIRRIIKYVTKGMAEGRSIGTNMSVFSSLTGTGYMPAANGKILFCEDTGIRSVDVERYFDIMSLTNSIRNFSGFVFGEFRKKQNVDEGTPYIEDVVRDYMERVNKPSLYSAPFGHGSEQMLIPLNLRMRIRDTFPYIEPLENMVD
jgi:muramoyltetrapeptide carboxypeptidase